MMKFLQNKAYPGFEFLIWHFLWIYLRKTIPNPIQRIRILIAVLLAPPHFQLIVVEFEYSLRLGILHTENILVD